MRETMKEVVVTAPHKVEIREAPIPVPKDDEVLIRMKSAGVAEVTTIFIMEQIHVLPIQNSGT